MPALEDLFIDLKAADKAVGDVLKTFRARFKSVEQSSSASTSLRDMINPLEILRREHYVTKAFEVYTTILVRHVRLLRESASNHTTPIILAYLRQTSKTLKDQMLRHSRDFM